jgi:hypothetical protein
VTTDTALETPSRSRRARRFLRDTVIAAVSLGVGLAAVSIAQRDDGNGRVIPTDDRASVAQLPISAGKRPAPGGDAGAADQGAEVAPIKDAARAVTSFLDAERRGDFETSYALLVAEDRERFPSRARWDEAHHEIPEVTSFGRVEQTEATAARATTRVDLALRPRLDESVGVVAARASAIFVAHKVAGGWRIAFSESSLTPRFPDERGARSGALAWAKARQRCERRAEWKGGLLGVAAQAYADTLCHTTAAVRAGEPFSLDRASGTEPVLAAFGPEASIWSRVVRISGPIDLDVVTAPLGEAWVVVAVLQTSSGGSLEPS